MDELGNFISRYYVMKSEGIFTKHGRFLNIYENGFEFSRAHNTRGVKAKDIVHYKDFNNAIPSNNNDRELAIKTAKQSFNVACSSRLNLLIDLLLYKDLWDLKNNSQSAPGVKRFESGKEMNFNDPSSCIPVQITLLRSALLIESQQQGDLGKGEDVKEGFKAGDKYLVKYKNILSIITLSHAITVNTKVL